MENQKKHETGREISFLPRDRAGSGLADPTTLGMTISSYIRI